MCFSRYREVIEQRADLGMSATIPTPEQLRKDYNKQRQRLRAQARRRFTKGAWQNIELDNLYWRWIREIELEVLNRRGFIRGITGRIRRMSITDSVREDSHMSGTLAE